MLAALLREHPCELRADFQRFYRLNLDDMGGAYSVRHAADLAACLPRESATVRALDPRAAWGDAENMLAYIGDNLAFLRYEQSGGKRRRPKPLPRPKPARRKAPPPRVGRRQLDKLLFGERG